MKELKETMDVQAIGKFVMILPCDLDTSVFDEAVPLSLLTIIEDRLKETIFSDWSAFDICSTSLQKLENGNMIFSYKAVPATASTMSAYKHRHLLVVMSNNTL